MSNKPITVISGDTKPDLLIQLFDSITGEAINLVPATISVRANFRKRGTTTLLISERVCEKLQGGESAGQVVFTWPGPIPHGKGAYELEIYVVDGSTSIQTMQETIQIRVKDDF